MSARWLLLLTLTATSVGCLPDRLSTADEDTAKAWW